MSLHQKVWSTLSKVDVSNHIERKGNLDYLSWAFAYQTLCEHFPNNSYSFTENEYKDGTMMVECVLVVQEGEEMAMRTMWLPVMDYRNKPIANPDAFAINTTRMRCLVKALAMFGLGISVYGGSVELTGEKEETKKPRINREQKQLYVAAFLEALEGEDSLALKELGDELKEDEPMMSAVWGEFSSKQKAKIKELIDTLRKHSL